MSTSRDGLAAAVYDGKIFAAGGKQIILNEMVDDIQETEVFTYRTISEE